MSTYQEAVIFAILLLLSPFQSKYSPQHPVIKHSQSMFFPQCEKQSSTHIQQAKLQLQE